MTDSKFDVDEKLTAASLARKLDAFSSATGIPSWKMKIVHELSPPSKFKPGDECYFVHDAFAYYRVRITKIDRNGQYVVESLDDSNNYLVHATENELLPIAQGDANKEKPLYQVMHVLLERFYLAWRVLIEERAGIKRTMGVMCDNLNLVHYCAMSKATREAKRAEPQEDEVEALRRKIAELDQLPAQIREAFGAAKEILRAANENLRGIAGELGVKK